MRIAHAPTEKLPPASFQEVLRSFHEHQRLVKLVTTMTHEIERLHEDNAQLHAAVKMYREVARRCRKASAPRARVRRMASVKVSVGEAAV